VVALYNIPNRDCGGYSATGAPSVSAYIQWIKQAVAGIGGRSAVVILEPDALAGADCLSSDGQSQRYQAVAQAVTIIKALPHASVYIDAGNPTWQSATTISQRLEAANIAQADGFSLNISYFTSTAQNISYGDQISKLVGNKHYVIDTSRSGGNHNVSGAQFNPSFASLGDLPTTKIDNARIDALLWIKIPWESDGPVNGGPSPGTPYWSYAIQLAKNAGW
jgi:endoglucanase